MAHDARKTQGQAFGASGTNHSTGLVPDPGSSAGTSRFLREDATFAAPAFPADKIPTGSVVAFYQASVPAGWTRVTTFDDALTRVVGSATPSSGGTNGFVATVNGQTATGSTTITSATMPAHTHPQSATTVLNTTGAAAAIQGACTNTLAIGGTTGSTGSGGSHNHTVTFAIKYVDCLLASAP